MKRATQFFRNLSITWYLAIVLAIGAFVRLLYITKASIWHDEGYTMMLINFSPLYIIARTARDVHPPLYYLVTHFWQGAFGSSELAIRSLSAVFGLVTIVFCYLLMRRLFGEGTARLAALFVALGPFAVRYSDEARMYGMAAMLVVIATYLVVRIATTKNASHKLWILYGITLAAGLYTHYYTLFIVPAHLMYLTNSTSGWRRLIANKKAWAGYLLGAAIFVPWLPTVYAQMTRVQAGFWIPPVDVNTLPSTFMQFAAFLPTWAYPGWVAGALLALFALACTHLYRTSHKHRSAITLLLNWMLLPLAIVMLVSLVRPVYYDRYFIYCAVAMYLVMAVVVTHGQWHKFHRTMPYILTAFTIAIFTMGIGSVGSQATHRMGAVGQYVNSNYQRGDIIVSGDLYTYFDFDYYNHTGATTRLLVDSKPTGYGETSLIYDKPNVMVYRLNDINHANRVWIVGKAGDKSYYTSAIPSDWRLAEQFQAGESTVRLYLTR